MDLYFATCKLKIVEIQDNVDNIQVVFVEIQVIAAHWDDINFRF